MKRIAVWLLALGLLAGAGTLLYSNAQAQQGFGGRGAAQNGPREVFISSLGGYFPIDALNTDLTAIAGVDRDVMTNGKTYLTGYAGYGPPATPRRGGRRGQAAETPTPAPTGPAATVTWSKEKGPGSVKFEDPSKTVTTATFSAKGDYVLKLTANNGQKNVSSTLNVKVVDPPPADRLDVVYTKNYTLDNPLYEQRVKALITGWIPNCIDRINDPNQSTGGIDNFIEAAKAVKGEPHGRHKGYVFANAWVHQTVESMCLALMVNAKGDPDILKAQQRFRETLEDWIPKILAAQEPDGYLQTAIELGDGRRWTNNGSHEGYTAGYFIESAINDYTMTGGKDLRLYNAAKKLADCWCNNLGPGKKEWYDGHEEMEQALVRFGRFVNDMEGSGHGDRYIQLAKFLLDERGVADLTMGPSRDSKDDYDQDYAPITEQYEAVGHAVRAAYLMSGIADVAAETHNIDYQSTAMSLWDNMVNKKYYLTGGTGTSAAGAASEGFAANYVLPDSAYAESCANCGDLFFHWKMMLAYHDAQYADRMEDTIYNAIMGDIDLDGKTLCYTNTLSGGNNRQPWQGCPCCVGNVPRTLLMVPTWTYAKGKDALYVNLFIGSTINIEKFDGMNVQMVQKTNYPMDGKVAITVNPSESKTFSLMVREPNRQTSELYKYSPEVSGIPALTVNGKEVKPKVVNGYAVINREWKKGDTVAFELPMTVQKVHADERIVADRGRVALRYGPLIYNFEREDQDINQPISAEATFKPVYDRSLLDGVVVALKGGVSGANNLMAIPYWARYDREPVNTERRGGRAGGGAGRGAGRANGATSATQGRRGGRGRGARGDAATSATAGRFGGGARAGAAAGAAAGTADAAAAGAFAGGGFGAAGGGRGGRGGLGVATVFIAEK